jgi:rhodanese-related sulfurtransferase
VNRAEIPRDSEKTAPLIGFVSPAELMAMLRDGEELAVLDVREELVFSQNHLLHARSVPLSRFEL